MDVRLVRIAADVAPHYRVWGDECVVYDLRSGETHLLGATAARLFNVLASGACDVRELTAQAVANLPGEGVERLAAVGDAVDACLRLGLIEISGSST